MAEVQESSNAGLPNQKWTLTKAAFDRLLTALDADHETASQTYLLLRRNLVRYFEGRGCPFAEDHADEVINRLAKKLDEGEPIHNLNGYAIGVARLLLLEVFKKREREEKAFKELPSLPLVESHATTVDRSEQRLVCLNHCLEKLPSEGRQLILGYYQGDSQSRIASRKQLGEAMGIPNQALRSRAVRLREKIEACLTTCLKKSEPQ